jgi:hypothetical protein
LDFELDGAEAATPLHASPKLRKLISRCARESCRVIGRKSVKPEFRTGDRFSLPWRDRVFVLGEAVN